MTKFGKIYNACMCNITHTRLLAYITMIVKLLEKIGLKRKQATKQALDSNNYHEIFKYEFMPTFDKESSDYMIRFMSANNGDYLIGKLLFIFEELKFDSDGSLEMIDEIWINAKSKNGQITITRDIYDFVFIMAKNNKTDLARIDNELNNSVDFERIELKE
jgi:hypothetical protein